MVVVWGGMKKWRERMVDGRNGVPIPSLPLSYTSSVLIMIFFSSPGPEDVGLCPPTHQTKQESISLINEEVVSCKKVKQLYDMPSHSLP